MNDHAVKVCMKSWHKFIPREARFPQHNPHFKIESDEYVRMYVRTYVCMYDNHHDILIFLRSNSAPKWPIMAQKDGFVPRSRCWTKCGGASPKMTHYHHHWQIWSFRATVKMRGGVFKNDRISSSFYHDDINQSINQISPQMKNLILGTSTASDIGKKFLCIFA